MAPRKDKKNHPGYDERGKRMKLTEEEKASLGPNTFPYKGDHSLETHPNRIKCLEALKKFRYKPEARFATADDLATGVDQYLEWCEHRTVEGTNRNGETIEKKKKRPYTFAGLAAFLGFPSGSALFAQAARGDEFKQVIDLTRTIFEAYLNEKLIDYSGMAGGIIFALKNTHGWTDQSQVNIVGSIEVSGGLTMMPPEPKDMIEWQKWYKEVMDAKNEPEAIDVTPETCALPAPEERNNAELRREMESGAAASRRDQPADTGASSVQSPRIAECEEA